VRSEQEHVGGEGQDGGVGIESQKEGQEGGGEIAFSAGPAGFGGCPGEDAGEGGVAGSGDAQKGADGCSPQQVHGGDKRRFIEPGVAVDDSSALHLEGYGEGQDFAFP